jgi:methionine synthase / methylenetetrahydrofolate reductase(NADPH)
MNRSEFALLLKENGTLVSDGAMGSMLQNKGIEPETCLDELNLTNPGVVADIHRQYIEAGANIIQTNTFGANRFKLERQGLANQLEAINTAGVDIARRAAQGVFKEVLIAGDIGPLGVRLAPYGRVKLDQAREAFTEQAAALVNAGCDLLILETFSDLVELKEAILAIHLAFPEIPLIASLTYTRDDVTILGDTPGKVAKELFTAGADVVGANCSGGPAQLLRVLKLMRQAVPDGFFSLMPNAGWPEQVGGRIMYPAAPEYFGDYALLFRDAGTSVIGGCCGTTPNHIEAVRKAIDSTPKREHAQVLQRNTPDHTNIAGDDQPTELARKFAEKQYVVAVEMDPPRGLSTHKLLAGASMLAEAGADVIDVADSPMARMRMSPWAVCSLIQRKTCMETVLHFPTRGRNILRVQGDLLAAHALGIRNVFVVMGDPTSIGDYPEAHDNYDLVPSGLIKLIKQGFNAGLDHAGSEIGQPTSFFVACALNLVATDFDQEIKNLQRKVKAGADYALTQPVFDASQATKFIDYYQANFGSFPIPLLVGVLPLNNPRHARFLNHEVPGISIPEQTLRRMDLAGEKSEMEGVAIAGEIIEQMRGFTQGVYIMPAFGRYDLAAELIDRIKHRDS